MYVLFTNQVHTTIVSQIIKKCYGYLFTIIILYLVLYEMYQFLPHIHLYQRIHTKCLYPVLADLVKFVMCTPVSRDFVPFCKYKIRHVYPGNQVHMTNLTISTKTGCWHFLWIFEISDHELGIDII